MQQPGTALRVAEVERGHPGIKSWYVVGILALLYAFSIVDRLIMPVSILEIRRALGVSDFQVSLMMGLAFAIFYSLCGLPLGAMIDRYSRRWVIFSGIVVWSLAASACGLAMTPTQLFGARMAVGAGEAALSPAAYSILSDLFARDRLAAPISVYTMGGVLGSACALAGGGYLLQYFSVHGGLTLPFAGALQPWQSVFVCTGAPGLVVALLIFTFAEPSRRSNAHVPKPTADGSFRRFLKVNWRLLSLLFVGFGAAAMMPYGLSSWIPALMMRGYGLGPAAAGGTYGAILAICGLTAHALNGFVVDWLFRRDHRDAHLKFFIYSALISAPIVALGLISGRWPWLILAIVLAQLVLTPFVGYAAAAMQIITPSNMRGKISALFLFVISAFGLGLGPSAVAALSDFVFRSEAKLGDALAVFVCLCAGVAAFLLSCARPRFRLAVEAASLKAGVYRGEMA